MTESNTTENKEAEPRAKILILDIQPTRKQNIRISQELFGLGYDEIDKFTNIAVSSIKAPKLKDGYTKEQRELEADINIPESVEDYDAIIITGSPFSAYSVETVGKSILPYWKKDLIDFLKVARQHNIPMLGICFGSQIMTEAFGGEVVRMKSKEGLELEEAGWGKVKRAPGSSGDPVMKDLPDEFVVPQHHKDIVKSLPEGAVLLAENEYGVQGFRLGNVWGFEFHPERKPEKVQEYLEKPENLEEIRRVGRNPDEVKELGKSYSATVRTILSNFLRNSWKDIQ